MMKTLKIFLVSLLVLILFTNTSYATTEITEKANKSLEKMFTSDIKLEKNSSGEIITIKGQNVQIQGNEIKIVDTNNKQEFNIEYSIENTVCKFESTMPIQLNNNLTEEELIKELSPIMSQLGNYDICYLSVADALGVDLSLAYTYYVQNYNNELIDTQNKIYSIKTNLSEIVQDATAINEFTIQLEVNCLELMSLSMNDIDNTNTYKVTVIEKEEVKQPIKQEQDDKENKPQQDNKKEDESIIKQEIPKAGIEKVFGIIIFGIIICSIIIYKQNEKYKGIL